MMKTIVNATLLLLLASTTLLAQGEKPTFAEAAAGARKQVDDAVKELAALHATIKDEKLPLSRELSGLEAELLQVRQEHQEVTRTLDRRSVALTGLTSTIEQRQKEIDYLANLLTDMQRNFDSGLHITERDRYQAPLEAARNAVDNTKLTQQEVFETQVTLLGVSLDRIEDLSGGTVFTGSAVTEDGDVRDGTFVVLGPVAIFRSADGKHVGMVEELLNANRPLMRPFTEQADIDAASRVFNTNEGDLPVDTTLGNAHKIAETEETLMEHIKKGGVVMIPIFAMAGLALLIALYKWISLMMLRNPSRARLAELLDTIDRRDHDGARRVAAAMPGPVGEMLVSGTEHLHQPHELIEEVMYERVLTTRLKVQSLLPFIAICAASAPLLGLLGTVTGIINTFKMITVFGSGDVKSLSGGISEALITTKFGLIVAIPSLLLHAFLSRKARSVIGRMEAAGVAFMNHLSRSEHEPIAPAVESGPAALPVSTPGLTPMTLPPRADASRAHA